METMSPGEASDEELYQRVGRGDRTAFAVLVRRHHGRMLRIAWRVSGDHGRAEDVVQEAFTRAWTEAARWRPAAEGGTGRFTSWLTRVVLNLAIDGVRRVTPLGLEAADDVPSDEPAADALTEGRERDAAIARAVAALPERQRAVIALTYDQGLSNGEAALALDTTVGAVELLLVRARRSLRDSLQTYLKEGT
jgi:RNA polymerase sigma-70 factor (ECF subfamily)